MESLWHHLSAEEALEQLSSSRHGLAIEEAGRRLLEGRNELPRARATGAFVLFVRQFKSSLTYILLAAAAISFGLGDTLDGNVILAAVVLNVVVGFLQEYQAQRSLGALQSIITFQALVLRGGEERLVDASQVVPGDVLVLRAGNRVPADGRLLRAVDVSVDESTLTGESYPVPKQTRKLEGAVPLPERGNMVYMGTNVTAGSGLAVVTATGTSTEIGTIAALIQGAEEAPTPLQKRLRSFSRFLGTAILGVAFGLFALGLAIGKDITEIFTLSVAVAVAAIPEGLLIAVTVILAIGMKRILKRNALTRKLVAAETLGSTTVICTDKTGTLTEGEMSVVRLMTEQHDLGLARGSVPAVEGAGAAASARFAFTIGLLCNDAHIEKEDAPLEHRIVTGSPTERALVYAAHADGLTRTELDRAYPRLDTLPFDSDRKYMVTLHHHRDDGYLLCVKGAPERIIAMCTTYDREGQPVQLTAEKQTTLIERAERLSSEGLRVIALAYHRPHKPLQHIGEWDEQAANLTFVGLMGMKDPLRPTAKETVRLCQSAGIRIVMITGDHKLTAKAIAEELGLPARAENIVTGEELAAMSDYELEQRITHLSVYARVSPKDKIRIIDAWQAKGEVVAMTGDGVNDAPALQSANIGVALGSGTDVAKEAADIVLLDNHFATIVAAVREGRVIYENIKKVILYLLSDSFSEVILVGLTLLLSLFVRDFPLPLLAAQILWINLVTDGLPGIALTMEPEEREIMKEPPRSPSEPVATADMRTIVIIVSVISGLSAFALFLYFWTSTGDVDLARTVAFVALGIDSLPYAFSVRTLRHSLLSTNPFTNRGLLLAVVGSGLLQLAAVYFGPLQSVLHTVPLGGMHWLAIAGEVVLVLIGMEATKAYFRNQRPVKAVKAT